MRSLRLVLAFLPCIFLGTAPSVAQSNGSGCGVSETAGQVFGHGRQLLMGIQNAPRNAIRKENLKWELPLAAATGLLIASGDQPAADRVQSTSIQHLARRWSNVGLAVELGSGALLWGAGCASHRDSLRDNGLTVLTAMGFAALLDYGFKEAFNREYPYVPHSQGEFWEGGKSFPSGHATISFAFASAMAHRYPHHRWLKLGVYGLATGVALSRYPGKKHYLSDILVGSALGYVTGTYVATH